MICENELSTASKYCPKCALHNVNRLAFIHDAKLELMFSRTYERLSSVITSYREKFTKETVDNDTNNIVFNNHCKTLCNSTTSPFISVLLDVDGIVLSKSTWLFKKGGLDFPVDEDLYLETNDYMLTNPLQDKKSI